ncbi:endonuclease/exonuclease/phosphatase family protein [Ideonella sp.]|uniref:endonuclease/exonuclease/phosphatase family protein n=1 Tax=Ideonella sp. TaxID=1929293 RepID=UPI0035B12F59
METTLWVAGTVLAVATLLPLWRQTSWWVRVFDFPRLQLAAGLLAVLVGHAAMGGGGAAPHAFRGLLLACLVLQVRRILPYTRLARVQVQHSRLADGPGHLRLLFANVLQSNRHADGLLAAVRRCQPDVVLALEVDDAWIEALGELRHSHPHTLLRPQDNTYGMALYSRLPLIAPEVAFLVQPDVPSIHLRVRLGTGAEVTLHCLHPRPPAPGEAASSAQRDAELVLVGRQVKRQPGPVVVMGDMNDVAWSHTSALFRKISGLLDPRVGRGMFNTFNAKHRFVRFPLDHFFHSNDFRLVEFRRLPFFGSDHFPVYIHLSHEPEAEAAQPEPHADAPAQAEADEKLAEARP